MLMYGLRNVSEFFIDVILISYPQIKSLMENIERYVTLQTSGEFLQRQHIVRQDLLAQIAHLSIDITARDYFIVDRRFLAGVNIIVCLTFNAET